MTDAVAIDLGVIAFAIILLVGIANRIGVAYPILLVLGGVAIGYIPGIPSLAMPPDLVLVIFLPPLLYWESITAPTSEFFSGSGLWWISQLAIGLVIVTMVSVAAVAHALVPSMGWGGALVLGAIVASTDEVAFGPIIERIRIPRHVIATIEGESLVNDATSLVLYGIAITAVVGGTFSLAGAFGELIYSVIGSIAVGLGVGLIALAAWRLIKTDVLQGLVAITAPYTAYLTATGLHTSGVLAVVTIGLFVTRFTPVLFVPRARELGLGFFQIGTFLANAFIFVLVGMQFRHIMERLHSFSPWQLAWYAFAVCATVVVVRIVWVFVQGLIPATNEPEHEEGKADWSHVFVLAWSGMRGGISLAAALAIPLEAAGRPFPHRDLIIFLTFCVLIATLVGQGGTLPLLIRWLKVEDDGTDLREERIALAATAKAALRRLEEIKRSGAAPTEVCQLLQRKLKHRWAEYSAEERAEERAEQLAGEATLLRKLERDLIDAQRAELIRLRDAGKLDNTVLRRIQRLLDLQQEESEILDTTGHPQADVEIEA